MGIGDRPADSPPAIGLAKAASGGSVAAPVARAEHPAQQHGLTAISLTELVLDGAHNVAVLMDERGLVTYWNPSAGRVFGLSSDQAAGRPVASESPS